MIFNFQQIQEIISILKRNELAFLAKQLGLNYLTQGEINLLSASGIDLTKFTDSKGYIEYAYIFGIWADALGDKRTKNMTFRQFKDFMKSSNFIPLTEEEEFALKQLKTRAYTDITGLGSRIVGGTTNIIVRGNQQQQAQIRDIIKKKTIRAYELRQSSTKLASDLGHATQDWGRDWLRIAKYLMHSAFNTGKAQNILKNYGNDVEVYFDVYPKACRRCKELYLTDPDDENSQPKIFKLTDIIANGNNIGRKADDWLPTLDPIHPYCFASKATKIYTVDGWRNISDIRVGDLVLTHKNRFRKVTALSRRPYQGENLYTIYYAYTDVYGHRQIRKVKHITGNHPVLTTNGWRKVEELQIKDKVFLSALHCKRCGELIPLINDGLSKRQLCKHCRFVVDAKKQWKDDDFRKLISESTKREMVVRYAKMTKQQRKELTLRGRQTIAKKYPNSHPWMEEAIKKANSKNGQRKTFIERKLRYFCEQLGQHVIIGIYLKNDGSFTNHVRGYFPDLFIPKLGIILEADGMQWHTDKEYDNNRDRDIKNKFGYDTFRFSEEDIAEHGDKVYQELQNIFNNHEGNFEQISVNVVYVKKEENKKQCKTLYNFAVEEDESYVADGIVVHNCRCTVNRYNPKYEWNPKTHSFSTLKKVKLNKQVQDKLGKQSLRSLIKVTKS